MTHRRKKTKEEPKAVDEGPKPLTREDVEQFVERLLVTQDVYQKSSEYIYAHTSEKCLMLPDPRDEAEHQLEVAKLAFDARRLLEKMAMVIGYVYF